MTVDLESRTVKAGEGPDAIEDSFDIDDYTRWRLLEGLDDIGITLSHEDDIVAYEVTRPSLETGHNSLIRRVGFIDGQVETFPTTEATRAVSIVVPVTFP